MSGARSSSSQPSPPAQVPALVAFEPQVLQQLLDHRALLPHALLAGLPATIMRAEISFEPPSA